MGLALHGGDELWNQAAAVLEQSPGVGQVTGFIEVEVPRHFGKGFVLHEDDAVVDQQQAVLQDLDLLGLLQPVVNEVGAHDETDILQPGLHHCGQVPDVRNVAGLFLPCFRLVKGVLLGLLHRD